MKKEKRSPTGHRTKSQMRAHGRGYSTLPRVKAKRKKRQAARAKLEKEGLVKPNDGKDVDHKRGLSSGGTNARTNLRVQSRGKNRAGHNTHGNGRMVTKKKKKK